jgi:hypothetical protein
MAVSRIRHKKTFREDKRQRASPPLFSSALMKQQQQQQASSRVEGSLANATLGEKIKNVSGAPGA